MEGTNQTNSAAGALARRRHFYGRRLFEQALEMFCALSVDGLIEDVNPVWEVVLGVGRDDLVTRQFLDFVHPADRDATRAEIEKLARGDSGMVEFENRYRGADGVWLWLEWSAQMAPDEHVIYVVARDITERKGRERELEEAARLDPLTGLANRRLFEEAFGRELAGARRYGTSPALVMVDLDKLKTINDSLGHLVGDRMIRETADVLRATLRQSDLAARIGGDEFAIVLPDCNLPTADLVAHKIVHALANRYIDTENGPVAISASAGFAVYGDRGLATAQEIVHAADSAMYEAKRRGGGVAAYTADD